MRKITFLFAFALFTNANVYAQPKGNDVTAPLHALKPDYPVLYGVPDTNLLKGILQRVHHYLDSVTPPQLINKQTGSIVADTESLDTNTVFKQGDYRLTSYEWGVTYSAMQRLATITGNSRYSDYVKDRFDFLAKWTPVIKEKFSIDYILKNKFFNQPVTPHALDDAGAVCAAMIKAQRNGLNSNLRPMIDNYISYIFTKEFRLKDGTIARNRPQKNTLWLDDLYMYIPAVAQMGKLTGDKRYYDDVVKQVVLYSKRMFNKEKGVYMHGWVESMDVHPQFHWARANGWALMAMSELLDVLPENHAGYPVVLQQFRQLAGGLARYQSGSGFWHQLLDKEDSYLETSATAIYSYCMAHACNKGWLDPMIYGPASILAWNAVSSKINDKGQVEGTCVGTGMAFDPLFYYHRPVNVYAAHGYGPAILAGAEILELLRNYSFNVNDSALQLKEKIKR